MTCRQIFKMVISVFVLVGATATNAELVSLTGASNDQYTVTVPVDNDMESEIHFTLNGFQSNEFEIEGTDYQQVAITNSGVHWINGNPQLPMIGKYIAIPDDAIVNVEVIDSEMVEYDGYNIMPAQPDNADSYEHDIPAAWTQNEGVYATDEFYPQTVYKLEGPYTVRSKDMALLRLYPIQVNPVTEKIRVYSSIKLKLTYTRQFGGTEVRASSAVFDNMVDRLTVNNPDEYSPAAIASDEGQMLLIVTADEFIEAANTLKVWKEQKGIETVVVKTSVAGSNENEIKAYIQNAYDNWELKPTYILLLGDAKHIPVHFVIDDWDQSIDKVGTDLYYATVSGDDFMPDISLGRLSVDTVEQANARVNKIISYEKTPPTKASFYKDMTFAGYFEDRDDDGMADKRFAHTLEDLAIYFTDTNYLGGYDANRIYYTPSYITPTRWNDGIWRNHIIQGPAGGPGDPIPSNLKRENGFAWDGSTNDVIDAFNEGTFLVVHRDHGGVDGWGDPKFDNSDIADLNNGDLLPVVFSINCLTGKFYDSNIDSFSETLERSETGGAVGVIAATSITYTWHNNVAVYGWIDAIWPTFVDYYNGENGGINDFEPPIYEMGQVLNYGKFFLNSRVDSGVHYEIYDEFHWFGDPTMQIWTKQPADMNVTYSASMPDLYTVNLSVDISGAVIALSKNGELLSRRISQAGEEVTYTLDEPVTNGEEIDIVITKHNYRPFVGKASFVSGCESFNTSLDQHVAEGRAYTATETTGETCWGTWCWGGTTTTTYYGIGSDENLGTIGSTIATLVETSENYFEIGEECPVTNPPELDSIATSPDGYSATISGTAHDIDGDLEIIQVKIDSNNWEMASGTSNWSIIIDDLSIGSHAVKARAVDAAGNISSEIVSSVEIDVDRPPQIESFYYTVKNNRLDIYGEASDPEENIVEIRLLNTIGEYSCSGLDGFMCAYYNLAPGDYNIAIQAIDATGLESEVSEEITFSIYLPTAPTVDAATTTIDNTSLSIAVDASDINNDLASAAFTVAGVTRDCIGQLGFHCNMDLSSLELGQHTAVIVVTDEYGNNSEPYEVTFTYTLNAPVIEQYGTPYVDSTTANVNGTASDIDGDINAIYITDGASTTLCQGTQSFSCSATNLTRGQNHTFSIYGEDNEGNRGEPSTPFTVHIGYAPVIESATTLVEGNKVTITVFGSDVDNDIVGAVMQMTGGRMPCGGAGAMECVLEGLSAGDYVAEVQLVDQQLNMSEFITVEFTIPPVGNTCITATNSAHSDAGRATIKYGILAYGVGSNDYLGLSSGTTSLEEISAGNWTKKTSCP